jgi:hypothetical protein
MTGMNRLSPWIVRNQRPDYLRPRSMAAVMALPRPGPLGEADAATWLDDLRLFATVWIGGLIFFGTLIG